MATHPMPADEAPSGPVGAAKPTSSWGPLALRWFSVGGAVTVSGLASLAYALKWNGVARGLSAQAGSPAWAEAVTTTEQYGLWGVGMLVVGQHMLTRRTIERGPDD
ncbi:MULTISPECIES: hypothetical protein [unclassified Actinotalea]|uniref:hypothetical protein n=1 Tax=unclassified Actinotalea TaxID=2638618 RepID=UPI0015F74677|nr:MULTISPECIES: hypothetical protein [unclassified Actinotalea]